ncbi:MAG: caspase domain-containing protein [Oligoflexales bacterium]
MRNLLAILALISSLSSAAELKKIQLTDKAIEQAFKPKRIVLVVGIKDFTDKKFRELKYPLKDVEDITTFLQQHNKVEADQFITVTNENATAKNVLHAFDVLEKKVTSEDDIVIVYFSTHGTLAYDEAKNLKRYAVAHDTGFDNVEKTGVAIDYIQTRIARLKSKKKALILALCHSGSGKSQLPEPIQKELLTLKSGFFPQPLHEVSSAMMILSASSWGQPAREDENLRNDIYTHFLIEGLKSYDVNQDGGISLFEAHEYARSHTYDFTKGQQTPSALLNVEGADPIILNGEVKRTSRPVIFADIEGYRNLQLQVDGQTKGTLWNPQKLNEGHVKITLVDPQDPDRPVINHHVFLQADRTYPVSSLIKRPPSFYTEVQLYELPLPLVDDLNRQSLVAPGVVMGTTQILATDFNASLGVYQKEMTTRTQIDFSDSPARYHAFLTRANVGRSFYPLDNLSIEYGLGLNYLKVDRIVYNDALEDPKQSAALSYPNLFLGVKALNLASSLFVGGGLTLAPRMKFPADFDDHTLRPITANASAGFAF